MSKAVRLLYRLFLKEVKTLEKQNLHLSARMPIDTTAWLESGGGHEWSVPSPEVNQMALKRLFPYLPQNLSGTFSPKELKDTISDAFRNPAPANAHGDPIDRAFSAIRLLSQQIHMEEASSSCTTRGVVVEVTTAFVGRQSDIDITYEPEEGVNPKLYFTYRVRITNTGQDTVQLQSRHWIIKDHTGKTIAEVPRGASGVVGCTPILKPMTTFQYYSGTDMEEQGGSMEGSFQMAVLGSKGKPVNTFDARIAPFRFMLRPGDLQGSLLQQQESVTTS